MGYQHIQVPSEGEKITVNSDNSLNVPNNPIIPYIMGDGTGSDITPTMQKVVDAAVEMFGRVDVMFNNAGIVGAIGPITDTTAADWRRTIDVDLLSVFLGIKHSIPLMRESGSGSIINLSSASSTVPLSKVFTYSISKHGVNGMTKFLAREWAPHNIRVNTLVPGFFPAEQNRKVLTPDRIDAIISD